MDRAMNRSSVKIATALVWLLAALAANPAAAQADDNPPADSPLVKLLKNPRLPTSRLGAIVDMVGKRGNAADLTYLYERALDPAGFPAEVRARAFTVLAESAANRHLQPARRRDEIVRLIPRPDQPDPANVALGELAIELAGLWRLEAAANPLLQLARSVKTEEPLRTAALSALARLGRRQDLEELTHHPDDLISLAATAALVNLDPPSAARHAAELLPRAALQHANCAPLLHAFLEKQGGSEVLAQALAQKTLEPDTAKILLRSVYAQGRSDTHLVSLLARAAGLDAKPQNLSPQELANLVEQVNSQGDPARGEAVFRRSDINCTNCHSVAKAGGEIGPDLSAIGATSPVDYLIRSILNPDESIKEQYHTLVVLTVNGQIFQGIVADKDDQRILLKEADGQIRSIPVDSIEDQKEGGSLMPKGLANLMTHAEFLDLVRFLSELGKPGPYAIRPIPSFQRYRVLKQGLDPASPNPAASLAAATNPSLWTSAYALVNGHLPLDEITTPPGKLLTLQGELDVSTPGQVEFILNSTSGLTAWIDQTPATLQDHTLKTLLTPGRHQATFLIDRPRRPEPTLKVDIQKPAQSTLEFTVVGGK